MTFRSPLLRPHHFPADCLLSLTDAGLRFSTAVGEGDREFECIVSGLAEEHLQRLLRNGKGRVGRVVLNPRRPSLRRLVERLSLDRGGSLRDGVVPISGMPSGPVRRWQHRVQPTDGYSAEGQPVVMVAVHQREPIGYFGGSVEVIVHGDGLEVYLVVAADMVYVVPRYRGQGFSMDLSVATGVMLRELLQAVYRAAPRHSEVNVILRADIHTTGGDHFARKLAECLEYELEVLQETGRRKTVKIGSFDFEGGW